MTSKTCNKHGVFSTSTCPQCGSVGTTMPEVPAVQEMPAVVYLFTPEEDITAYELAQCTAMLFNCRDGYNPREQHNKMHPMSQRHFTAKPLTDPAQESLPLDR